MKNVLVTLIIRKFVTTKESKFNILDVWKKKESCKLSWMCKKDQQLLGPLFYTQKDITVIHLILFID